MIGLRGTPLECDFEWAKWRKNKAELLELGASIVMTDEDAKKIGILVHVCKRNYQDAERIDEALHRPRPVAKRRVRSKLGGM